MTYCPLTFRVKGLWYIDKDRVDTRWNQEGMMACGCSVIQFLTLVQVVKYIFCRRLSPGLSSVSQRLVFGLDQRWMRRRAFKRFKCENASYKWAFDAKIRCDTMLTHDAIRMRYKNSTAQKFVMVMVSWSLIKLSIQRLCQLNTENLIRASKFSAASSQSCFTD